MPCVSARSAGFSPNAPAHRLSPNIGSVDAEMIEEPPQVLRRDLQAVLLTPWRTVGLPMPAWIPENQVMVPRKRLDLPGPHAGVAAQAIRQHQGETAAIALIVEMDAVDVCSGHVDYLF